MMPRAVRVHSVSRSSQGTLVRQGSTFGGANVRECTALTRMTTAPARSLASLLGATLLGPLLLCLSVAAEPTAPPTPPAQGAAAPATPPAQGAGDAAALKQRVEQLEEQLVDMQVVVGTLESLARGGNAAPAPGMLEGMPSGAGAANEVRLDGLETQVRALAAQIEQLTQQVHALSNAPRRADTSAVPPANAAAPANPSAPGEPDTASRFGSTTVTAGSGDAIRGLLDSEPQDAPAPGAPPGAPSSPAKTPAKLPASGEQALAATPPAFAPPPLSDADNPKQLYETAYGYLMQRDYGAAQATFEDFLKRYPKDSLAGNAQYWLGEAHFVRGDYKSAAGAFLKGYQDYHGNPRAADSLLKLAMSLDRLGQTDGACSSFAELAAKFPDAPENVKSRAKSERQRIGCR